MKLAFPTTNISGLHPAVEEILPALDGLWKDHAGYELTITHGLDGKHSRYSRHYWGGAIDIRTHTKPGSWIQITGAERRGLLTAVKELLGNNFNVLDEETHFHVAFKPEFKAWTT